jgi:hypothetical protein
VRKVPGEEEGKEGKLVLDRLLAAGCDAADATTKAREQDTEGKTYYHKVRNYDKQHFDMGI